MVELARNAKRHRQVEMADPQAVDAIDSGNLVGIFGTFGSLDLAEQRCPLIGGRKLLLHRALPIGIMRNAQGNATSPIRIIFRAIDDGFASAAVLTIGIMIPSAPMSQARAM